jgi:hypothetical protein
MNGTISEETIESNFPFQMTVQDFDDRTVAGLKEFFRALHRAWALNVALLLDV